MATLYVNIKLWNERAPISPVVMGVLHCKRHISLDSRDISTQDAYDCGDSPPIIGGESPPMRLKLSLSLFISTMEGRGFFLGGQEQHDNYGSFVLLNHMEIYVWSNCRVAQFPHQKTFPINSHTPLVVSLSASLRSYPMHCLFTSAREKLIGITEWLRVYRNICAVVQGWLVRRRNLYSCAHKWGAKSTKRMEWLRNCVRTWPKLLLHLDILEFVPGYDASAPCSLRQSPWWGRTPLTAFFSWGIFKEAPLPHGRGGGVTLSTFVNG